MPSSCFVTLLSCVEGWAPTGAPRPDRLGLEALDSALPGTTHVMSRDLYSSVGRVATLRERQYKILAHALYQSLTADLARVRHFVLWCRPCDLSCPDAYSVRSIRQADGAYGGCATRPCRDGCRSPRRHPQDRSVVQPQPDGGAGSRRARP